MAPTDLPTITAFADARINSTAALTVLLLIAVVIGTVLAVAGVDQMLTSLTPTFADSAPAPATTTATA